MNDTDFVNGSGNVFKDLGFKNADEELAKAKLSIQIASIIDKRGLKQKKAATILGIKQSEVSHLVRGKTERFTLDRLIKYLNLLDMDVEIITREKPHRRMFASVTVSTV